MHDPRVVLNKFPEEVLNFSLESWMYWEKMRVFLQSNSLLMNRLQDLKFSYVNRIAQREIVKIETKHIEAKVLQRTSCILVQLWQQENKTT